MSEASRGWIWRAAVGVALVAILYVALAFAADVRAMRRVVTHFHGSAVALAIALVIAFLLALRSVSLARFVARQMRRVPRWREAADHLEASHPHARRMLAARPLAVPVVIGLAAYLLEATALWGLCRIG